MKRLTATKEPVKAIDKIAYEGQPLNMRMYQHGYENFFNHLPVLSEHDDLLSYKIALTREILGEMSEKIRDSDLLQRNVPDPMGFNRTILALEEPVLENGTLKEGAEIIIAQWGDGFTSPVHGHSAGYMHEEILTGKMRVNTYRLMDDGMVRPYTTEIYKQGVFVSNFNKQNPKARFKREALIHNFTSIGYSASMHYLPEHTRDSRDNKFAVQRFDDVYNLTKADVKRISPQEGYYMRKGEVALARSINVPDYGDHYIIITGHPVMKEHGMRPQEVSIHAPYSLLSEYPENEEFVLLQLSPAARDAFHDFHGIRMINNEVVFPHL